MDTSESAYLQAKAAVKQSQANLDLDKIDLSYTEIKAPISGRIGKALVTEGNYVASTLQTLARIVQTNPIRVAFSITAIGISGESPSAINFSVMASAVATPM